MRPRAVIGERGARGQDATTRESTAGGTPGKSPGSRLPERREPERREPGGREPDGPSPDGRPVDRRPVTDSWVEVGRVVGAFGVQGAMKVEPWADPAESVLTQVTTWHLLGRDGVEVDLAVASLAVRPDVLIAEFDPVRSREQIQAWKGATLSVRRSAFPSLDDDEYYWSDLIGCTVENRQGQVLGTVSAVLDLGADPLLQIDGRLLIPFIGAYVDTVDVTARRIAVDWSEDWS